MRINFNVSSIIAKNALAKNDARFSESTLKLSSGYKINKASDNAAGLAIARKMNAQIRGIIRANENASDGISVVNTADGAMSEMHNILQRMNELSIKAANGTNSDSDREKIQLEIDQLLLEVDRIADTTQFNAQPLLDGTFAHKGYTNTENVRMMTSTDGVTSGTYIIESLSYSTLQKKITTYGNKGTVPVKITNEEIFDLGEAGDIRKALVQRDKLGTYSTVNSSIGLKAFPDDSLVSVEDEYIIIKSKSDFEIKLAVNDKEALEAAGLATTTATTPLIATTLIYRDISVTTDPPEQDLTTNPPTIRSYTLGEIRVDDTIPGTVNEESLKGIAKDLDVSGYFARNGENNVEITGITLVTSGSTSGNMTITYDSSLGTGRTLSLKLKDASAKMDDYLSEKEEVLKTDYIIGGSKPEDCVILNITDMGPMRVQVGANEGQYLDIEIPDLNTLYLGISNLDLTTQDSATKSIDIVGKAINYLSAVRAKIGAYTNRLEQTVKNLETTEENMTASYSRIMDVDMAKEMAEYTTVQVLVQASTSMLAQANQRPQQVLQLLQ